MDIHPSDELRKLMAELTDEPQLTEARTKALLNILIDMADRIQMVEQQLGQDY